MTEEHEMVENYNKSFTEEQDVEQIDAVNEVMSEAETEEVKQPWADLPTDVIYYEKMYDDGHLGSSTENPEMAYKFGWTGNRIGKDEVRQSDKNGWAYLKDKCPMQSNAELQAAANLVRIKELKEYLRETDYQAIKYAEGRLTDDEYADASAERERARKEIRALEKENDGLLKQQ